MNGEKGIPKDARNFVAPTTGSRDNVGRRIQVEPVKRPMGLAERLGATEEDVNKFPPNEDARINEPIQSDENGDFVVINGKRVDIPKFEPVGGEKTVSAIAKESVPKTQAEVRTQNLEGALEDKMKKLFQGEGSPLTAELITREVVRTFLLEKPGESTSTGIESKINALQRHMEDLLGGGDLTVSIGEDGAIDYLAYPGAKEGAKKTLEVPIQGSNKIITLEFTPLVVPDSKNPDKMVVKKVLCNEVKIIEK